MKPADDPFDDERTLRRLGYVQELRRGMGAFSNFAISLSIICYTPVYETITTVTAILLYVSYVLPTLLGLRAHGRTWTRMGPWHLGAWYRPLAVLCVLGCGVLFVVGVQPPNDKALWLLIGFAAALAVLWFAVARRRFRGPPVPDVARVAADVGSG